MKPVLEHDWDLSEEAARQLQNRLAGRVLIKDSLPGEVSLIVAVDAAYGDPDLVYGAAVVMDVDRLAVVEQAVCRQVSRFPYIPELFSFRELPAIIAALERLESRPQLILCDAHGYSHPRRFGLASHIGVLFDMPSIGCAKTRLIGQAGPLGNRRGDLAYLEDKGEIVGAELRTADGVRPLYVSAGHRISLESACRWVLQLGKGYRLPEPIRAVNSLVQQEKHRNGTALAGAGHGS